MIRECVPNNILLDKNLIFINGSNMSGKTTFMRTIGVNVLLARTIYTCLATKAELSFFNIYSSMRISDDLAKSQSYFLSELIRLREFVELSKKSFGPNLFLIDEILKGTNVIDRINISNSILKFLQTHKENLTIATSHDIDIVKKITENILHFHFDEDIVNNEMIFDIYN